MTKITPDNPESLMNSTIHEESIAYEGFLKVLKAQVSHDKFDGTGKIQATRECLERGDSVAVLLYQKDTDSFLFTKQYRYPSARRNEPWMVELVAGSIDEGEQPLESARREVLEELGYQVDELKNITTYFPSPGGCSEQIHLFYATVTQSQQVQQAGGKGSEKEDIELISLSRKRTKKMLLDGAFNNSISIIGLQWYFLRELA